MALMQASKKPAPQDPTGWNPYVDALIRQRACATATLRVRPVGPPADTARLDDPTPNRVLRGSAGRRPGRPSDLLGNRRHALAGGTAARVCAGIACSIARWLARTSCSACRICAQQKGRRMRRLPWSWLLRPAAGAGRLVLSRRRVDRGCRRHPDARRRGGSRLDDHWGRPDRASARRHAGRPDAPSAARRRRG